MPLALVMIGDLLGLSSEAKDRVWQLIFILDIVLLVAAFKIEKETKTWKKVLIGTLLVLAMGYVTYFL